MFVPPLTADAAPTPSPTAAVAASQVPYLEDPNQGVYLFESSAIVKYLEDTYAVKP